MFREGFFLPWPSAQFFFPSPAFSGGAGTETGGVVTLMGFEAAAAGPGAGGAAGTTWAGWGA